MTIQDIINIYDALDEAFDALIDKYPIATQNIPLMEAAVSTLNRHTGDRGRLYDEGKAVGFDTQLSSEDRKRELNKLNANVNKILNVKVEPDEQEEYEKLKKDFLSVYHKLLAPETPEFEKTQKERSELKKFMYDHFDMISGIDPKAQEDNPNYARDFKQMKEFFNTDPEMNAYVNTVAEELKQNGEDFRTNLNLQQRIIEDLGGRMSSRLNYTRGEAISNNSLIPAIIENNIAETKTRQYTPGMTEEENKALAGFGEKLDKAQTTFNSGEYTNLMKMVKDFGKREKLPQAPNLDPTETQIVKYALIKKQIDKYLEHKGKSGVKRNAVDKLEAIEELNRYVSEKLQCYEGKSIEVGSLKVNVEPVSVTYAQEYEKSAKANEAPKPSDNNTKKNLKDLAEDAKFMDASFTERKMNAINDCMNRIILNAAEHNRSEKTMTDLKDMKQKLLKSPFREEPKKELQKKNDTMQLS